VTVRSAADWITGLLGNAETVMVAPSAPGKVAATTFFPAANSGPTPGSEVGLLDSLGSMPTPL